MNKTTATRPRLQGYYPSSKEADKATVHPIKAEIEKNIGSFSFTARFEEDREAVEAFKNEGLIAYRCIITTPDGKRTLGIGHGMNVLSQDNRYLSKAARWAHGGAIISAVTNMVKFPNLSGEPVSDFGASDIASTFMATDKQKAFIRELIASSVPHEEQEEWYAQVDTMSKEDASEAIQMLKN